MVSQWKRFTASIVSLKIESCLFELMSFISDLIFMLTSDIMDLEILGEPTIAEAIER